MTYLFSWSDTSNTIQQHARIDIADNDTNSRYTDPYKRGPAGNHKSPV